MKERTETLKSKIGVVVGDNQMNGLEPCIRRENVFEISTLSGKCLHLSFSLNKLQAISVLSQRQSSNSENVDMLSYGESYFWISVQVTKSTDVH